MQALHSCKDPWGLRAPGPMTAAQHEAEELSQPLPVERFLHDAWIDLICFTVRYAMFGYFERIEVTTYREHIEHIYQVSLFAEDIAIAEGWPRYDHLHNHLEVHAVV